MVCAVNQTANYMNKVLPQISKRADTQPADYRLGVTLSQTSLGVVIEDVTKDSTAERIGLCAGAIIFFVNHKTINLVSDFNASLASVEPGKPAVLIAKMQDGAISFFNIPKD